MAGTANEVRLTWQVMSCHALRTAYDGDRHPCQFFGAHFGKYPAFDWPGMPSPAERECDASANYFAKYRGVKVPMPALAGGCRRAPIMVIGINPNLEAWWLSPKCETACYPHFESVEEYATYYRNYPCYQAHLPHELFEQAVVPGTEVRSAAAGELISVERDVSGERVVVRLKYEDDLQVTTIVLPRGALVMPKLAFAKHMAQGDLIAGVLGTIAHEERVDVPIRHEGMHYYEAIASIFAEVDVLLKSERLDASVRDASIQLVEDVLLGDMVACASPAWSGHAGGVPVELRDEVVKACCVKNQWLPKQFRHTQPVLLIFSGQSAFDMFRQADLEAEFIVDGAKPLDEVLLEQQRRTDNSPDVTGKDRSESRGGPIFQVTTEHVVRMRSEQVDSPPRIVVVPHFSYWPKPTDTSARSLSGDGESESGMSNASRVARVVVEELLSGGLAFDPQTKRLRRTGVSCRFCANESFTIGEGCRYESARDQCPM